MSFRNMDLYDICYLQTLYCTGDYPSCNNPIDTCVIGNKRCRSLTITAAYKKTHNECWWGWPKPNHPASDVDNIRIIVAYAFGDRLRTIIINLTFKFNNKLYKKMKGGTVGVEISRDVGNIFNVWWDRN